MTLKIKDMMDIEHDAIRGVCNFISYFVVFSNNVSVLFYHRFRDGACDCLCPSKVLQFGYKNQQDADTDTERPRDVPQIRNMALEKACNRGMTCKDTKDHYCCC